MPYDAVNSKILSVLSLIETKRGADNNRNVDKDRNLFEIDVVGEVGKDASTGETRYGCNWFRSTTELLGRIQEEVKKKRTKQADQDKPSDISRLTNVEIRSAIKSTLEPFKKSNSVTLSEVDDFVPIAKKYKVTE